MGIGLLVVGVDVGKRADYTAIVVANVQNQREVPKVDGMPVGAPTWWTHYNIRHLERLPLGMPYPEQVDRIIWLYQKAIERQLIENPFYNDWTPLRIDVTGVGDGVVDLLKTKTDRDIRLEPCRFVHGDKLYRDRGEHRVGKSWFANRLQVLAENGQIHLPDTAEARRLGEEMLDFDINIDETSGKETYGALRPGTHDDMVCALGLACLKDYDRI